MESINSFITAQLKKRKTENSLRQLKDENGLIDFSSNDYLGFSRSPVLKELVSKELQNYPDYKLGSTASRLLAGNSRFITELEKNIAAFHEADAALIFTSGYTANVGLFSCLPQRGDTIIADELIHASIIDGIRLSYSNKFVFRHNDLESLEGKLKNAGGRIYIAVESVYSMDGDEAPLAAICKLAEKYDAALIVDEAHAIGVLGKHGRGLVAELNLEKKVFATTITFGKALGVHGAAILGSEMLIEYLINFARSFIYTTASPFTDHLAVKTAYQYLGKEDHQEDLRSRILYFKYNVKIDNLIESRSAIQSVIIGGNDKTKNAALTLQKAGFDVRPILSPTVAEGFERLRICIHNHNSFEEIKQLAEHLNKLKNE